MFILLCSAIFSSSFATLVCRVIFYAEYAPPIGRRREGPSTEEEGEEKKGGMVGGERLKLSVPLLPAERLDSQRGYFGFRLFRTDIFWGQSTWNLTRILDYITSSTKSSSTSSSSINSSSDDVVIIMDCTTLGCLCFSLGYSSAPE